MSEYMICKGCFDDVDCLKEALVEHGFPQVEVHETAQVLHGYHNNRKTSAEVIIRAGVSGSRYDIGFQKTAEGFVPVMNDMDSRSGLGQVIQNGGLLQTFLKHKVLKQVEGKRCRVIENTVTAENKIRIVVSY